MNILQTNITDNEWNMELSYDLFENPDAVGAKDLSGEVVHVDKYCKFEEENSNGNLVTILAVLTTEGVVFRTTSPAFIRTFDRIMTLADKCGVTDVAISVHMEKSKNNRDYVICKYVK